MLKLYFCQAARMIFISKNFQAAQNIHQSFPNVLRAGIRGVCHDIIGTDGLGYAPPISKEDDIWLFNDQLCRSIWLSFAKEVSRVGSSWFKGVDNMQ